ncbi:MAG TPA: 50S ribosomal protein L32 [Candidatus Magasanikbacteria bacterium]|nr:50S ribosomal protein L32 [Candidatus Magasanikbacteria bacterium]
MGLPGHRRTSSDKRKRSAHFALKATTMNACPKCGKATRPHRACAFCGTYKGRQITKVGKKLNKKK